MTKRFIAINRVVISENRQRRQFPQAELNELAESIQATGLLHAPTLRIEGDNYVLVSGERRFRAIKDIYELGGKFKYDNEEVPSGLLPYTFLGDLSPVEAMEAELDENIRRMDLTWVERAAASAKLMELRSAQATASGKPAPTPADISEEVRGSRLGSNQDMTRKELILADHLHIPEVAAAKSVDEAFKILKRKEVARKNTELAETVGRTFNSSAHTLLNEDACNWMADAPAESFDIILTDPPYGMGADEFGNSGKSGEYDKHTYVDDLENAMKCYTVLAFEGFRITKPDAHLYAFCDIDLFPDLKILFADAGWKVFRTPLIWYKPSAFRAPWPEHGPQRKYETILFAIKGDRKVNHLYPDVLTYQPDTNLGHQAQKPVELFRDLLSRSFRPGDSVLDPFCGSGPIFPAAHTLQCRTTGIELSQSHYGIALKRLQSLSDEPTLPGLE